MNWKGFWNTSLDTIDVASPICPSFNESTSNENLSYVNGISYTSISVHEHKYNTNITITVINENYYFAHLPLSRPLFYTKMLY